MSKMSESIKHRLQTNSSDELPMYTNEKILKECNLLYTESDYGLSSLGENAGLQLLPPRKKITVMVMGNHSAGKSSFINWYVEENILKTGVAIETQGFSFVTGGKKRETLTGNATLHLFPHFQQLQQIEGLVDYLSTEVIASKHKQFPLLLFIDTPGLVDGDMKYPFDVNYTLQLMSDFCDVIFVFFDPMGQALCKRTLDIIDKVNAAHPEKIRFFLSKSDEIDQESDKQRVMMQVVQELCKRPNLSKTGFDMPSIYIPNENKPVQCVNQIDETCKLISKTVSQAVQKTLDQLEKDCNAILEQSKAALIADRSARTYNKKAKLKAMGLSLLGFIIPLLLIVQLMVASAPREALDSVVGHDIAALLHIYMEPCSGFWNNLGNDKQMTALTCTMVLSGICLILSRILGERKTTLQNKTVLLLNEAVERVDSVVLPRKKELYCLYLEQSVSDYEI